MKILAALAITPLLSAQLLYVGTYTAPRSSAKGIYAYRFNARTGRLTSMGLAAEGTDPTFLALHPNGKYLYAINEINEYLGQPAGSVTAYSIDKRSGKLTELNQVSSGGTGPCHLTVDATGQTLVVANYAGGSFSSFRIQPDGRLSSPVSFIQGHGSSIDKSRQMAPHGHSVTITKNNKFVLGDDLGTDKVMIFKLDPVASTITPGEPAFAPVKPGSGPRHLVIAPDQKHVYVLSEMGELVTTFTFDADTGAMEQVETVSALPADFKGESTSAEIQMDAAGKHVYASNRGHDSISVFDVDPQSATLKLVQNAPSGGKTPRAFVLDPSGNYVIAGNQDTNNIAVLKVDKGTGKLTPLASDYELGAPVTFVFVK